jgi:pyruvate carboxylase
MIDTLKKVKPNTTSKMLLIGTNNIYYINYLEYVKKV